MPIISLSNKTRSRSLLAGNPYFVPGDYESIATGNPNGSQSNITFSSIPSTYKHLQIRGIASNSTTDQWSFISFNGNLTASNYYSHDLAGNGSTVTASALSGTSLGAYAFVTSNNAAYGAFVIDILDYNDTNKNKTIRILSGRDLNGSGEVRITSGVFLSTAAITSIAINASNNWRSGSQFALYGIRG